MIKFLEATGDRGQLIPVLDAFIRNEVTEEKPKLNHLIMVVEHLISGFAPKGRFIIKLQVDLEINHLSFRADPVPE